MLTCRLGGEAEVMCPGEEELLWTSAPAVWKHVRSCERHLSQCGCARAPGGG